MNKNKIGLIVGVLVLVGISFYAGNVHGKSIVAAASTQNNFGGRGQNGGQRGLRGAGGFVVGKILSKDATSITVELGGNFGGNNPAGTPSNATGSKIVFYTDKTPVMKTVAGTASDLAVGTQVNITGTPNTDGSVNADSIQIRPSMVQ